MAKSLLAYFLGHTIYKRREEFLPLISLKRRQLAHFCQCGVNRKQGGCLLFIPLTDSMLTRDDYIKIELKGNDAVFYYGINRLPKEVVI